MKPTRSLPPPTRVLLRSLEHPSSPSSTSNRLQFQCLHTQQRRTFLRSPRLPRSSDPSHRAVEHLNVDRMRNAAYDYHKRRQNLLLAGAVTGLVTCAYTAYLLSVELRKQKPKKFDSGKLADPFTDEAGTKRKTVVHDAEGRELVPTGDSTVPTFPRLLNVDVFTGPSTPPSEGKIGGQQQQQQQQQLETTIIHKDGVEYTLVGLGTRTVSMFGIRVYVVGFYVATADVAALQARLVREINPIASTLIPAEKEALRRALLDPAEGERLWAAVLRDARPRSVFRIVPVRDTNFHHLRDGFVRAIQARTTSSSSKSKSEPAPSKDGDKKKAGDAAADDEEEFGDEAFGAAMREFKVMFNRGNVPKAKELLLCRDATGELAVSYDDGKKKKDKDGDGTAITIGRVSDERISRLLWLNYLAGSKVASEPARKNIVEGMMEFVERPIGTVATQVV